MFRQLFITCTICFCIGACKNEPQFEYSVPGDLQTYIKRFEEEANFRGVKIRITNLKLYYDGSVTLPECGLSNVISSSNDVQKIVRLNPDPSCWNCDAELEALIFHELGHCILGRQHNNELMPKGYPRTMMTANDNQIYTNCGYPINGTVEDLTYRRVYYLDELFKPSTPLPVWGK